MDEDRKARAVEGFSYSVSILVVILIINLMLSISLFIEYEEIQVYYQNEIKKGNDSINSLEMKVKLLEQEISDRENLVYQIKEENTGLVLGNQALKEQIENTLEPPYVSISEQLIHMKFKEYEKEGEIEWVIPFTSLEASVYNGFTNRQNLNYLTFNSNTNKVFEVVDFTNFVESEPFEAVINDFHLKYESDKELVLSIWNIVEQMTTYSYEIEETPKYPLETLFSGGGDCEDTAILLASLLKAVPREYNVSFVYMDFYNPKDAKELNHVAVYVQTPEVSYIIETTSDKGFASYEEVDGWFIKI